MREELQPANPWLFEVTAPAYIRRIATIQDQIAQYFGAHPADVSLMLPRLDQMEEAMFLFDANSPLTNSESQTCQLLVQRVCR